ncbi:hypothetical protein [Azospirillum griseum]|uniref:hypothetical protein n=1 Tax=Azospirillum griseum TaxID=2496639 RepID=UPI0013151823|nr:hypothetical protein [Azospirillum griseum]
MIEALDEDCLLTCGHQWNSKAAEFCTVHIPLTNLLIRNRIAPPSAKWRIDVVRQKGRNDSTDLQANEIGRK